MQCNVHKATRSLSNYLLNNTRLPACRRLSDSSALRVKLEESAPHIPPLPSSKVLAHDHSASLSRAACQAVRVSCNNGKMRDAFYIVNSLRYNLQDDNKIIREPQLAFKAIQFGQPVNIRLAYHALLHGLIRQGLAKKASQLAGLMIQDGVKIKSKTFEALTAALCQEAIVQPRVSRLRPSVLLGNSWVHTRDISPLVQNVHLREAIRLLHEAKQHRQRRTRGMFERLINACLLQGEILVGSLLFVLLVKDWERRRQLAIRLATQPGDLAEDQVSLYDHVSSESLFPSPTMMNGIIRSIEPTLQSESQSPETALSSLQALANLAYLLDNRQLPFGQIPTLIRALYRVPRTDQKVWVPRPNNGKPTQVKAYNYFHLVLKRLVSNLPTSPARNFHFDPHSRKVPMIVDSPLDDALPALDLPSYNALLHYALRHRLSPSMANGVLQHMTEKRHKPLQPDIATYNTLVRSSTLLRKNSQAEQILTTLRAMKENAEHPIQSHVVEQAQDTPCDPPSNPPSSRFAVALRHSTAALSLPPSVKNTALVANEHTLSSYILHLVSVGRPEAVADVLFHVLPELKFIDHPTLPTSDAPGVALRHSDHIERAANYGPHFFTNVLNALRKAGRTGLAERVWYLAQKAERTSWGMTGHRQPWCLPTAAYTVMIQCYADEAKRSTDREYVAKTGRTIARSEKWIPQYPNKNKVIGWARFAHQARAQYDNDRSAVGRYMGLLLFRSMKFAGANVYKSMLSVGRDKQLAELSLSLPRPDARFFNATLELCAIGQRPNTRSRSKSYFRRRCRFASYAYSRYGRHHPKWTPILQEVCDAMVEAGYTVPLGLAPLFVGRGLEGRLGVIHRASIDKAPYAYPRTRKGWYPHRLWAEKNNGLPRRRIIGRRACTISKKSSSRIDA